MGSGYFPIKKHSEDGETILRCAAEIENILTRWTETCLEQDQIDNAFFDGTIAGRMQLGLSLLRDDLK